MLTDYQELAKTPAMEDIYGAIIPEFTSPTKVCEACGKTHPGIDWLECAQTEERERQDEFETIADLLY